MAFKQYLIFLLPFFLAGCAQIGNISGGPEDTIAPRPVAEKVSPANGSINFKGNSVEITFDEFVRLNDPNLNIIMVPPHSSVQSRLKKRTLTLSWEEELEENTTYAIYLNNAVKDITEGNDTILKYVFSTGPHIDSLTYKVAVSNAWTGKALEKVVVGLFDMDNEELLSFAETDDKGRASFSFLKPRSYSVVSFLDINRDLIPQPHEAIGFSSTPLTLDSSVVDSIPLRLYYPIDEPKIIKKVFKGPGQFIVSANISLLDAEIFVNGSKAQNNQYEMIERDSLHLFVETKNTSNTEVVINSELLNDTILFRYSDQEKKAAVGLKPSFNSGSISPWDSLFFYTNDLITSIDSDKILLTNAVDSTDIENYKLSYKYNRLYVHINNKDSLDRINIIIKSGAVETANGKNAEYSGSCTLLPEKKFGSVALDLSYYQGNPIILLLIQSEKVIRDIALTPSSEPYLMEGLSSGSYSFRVVHDTNNNQVWDVGDWANNIQPEQIDYYSTTTSVRANWEVEATLVPNSSQ